MRSARYPVAVIGAGPVGLAAAAHLQSRGLVPQIFECGPQAGHNIRAWGHVGLFSPWSMNIDDQAARLLETAGWTPPPGDTCPTGDAFVDDYLDPLSQLRPIRECLHTDTRVIAVSRARHDRMKTDQRERAPFVLRVADARSEYDIYAAAVIDTSGTLRTPAPLGCHGITARGENALAEHMRYGLPDVLGAERARYANQRTLVVGGGHSAYNALCNLTELAEQAPATRILWALRRDTLEGLFDRAHDDALPERGRLALAVRDHLEAGTVEAYCGARIEALEKHAAGISVEAGGADVPPVDEIIAATGFRPDHGPLQELRLALDPATESPVALAPLVDPNVHTCGSVADHGAAELSHPEHGLYIAGIKSYGRAPTFLLRTGYRQVASIAEALAGETDQQTAVAAARRYDSSAVA